MTALRPASAALWRAAAASLFLVLICVPQLFAPLLQPLNGFGAPALYTPNSLWALALWHLGIVLAATLASTMTGVALGMLVTRGAGVDFMPLARSLTYAGQSFPPVVVLALAVPAVGFGVAPALIALFLYGLLPIFENTVTGLQAVPPAIREAARGMGMTPAQSLWQVEMPLALPLILAGVRLSAVISVGTATIGSTVATPGLGEVIIAGLTSGNTAFLIQGAVIVALMAVLLDETLAMIDRAFAPARA